MLNCLRLGDDSSEENWQRQMRKLETQTVESKSQFHRHGGRVNRMNVQLTDAQPTVRCKTPSYVTLQIL